MNLKPVYIFKMVEGVFYQKLSYFIKKLRRCFYLSTEHSNILN